MVKVLYLRVVTGGNVKVENGAVIVGGTKVGKGGSEIQGGDGGDIIIKDRNDGKSGDIYGNIEAGAGGSGFFKSGKGGNINNIDYKKNIDDKK